MAVVEDGAYPDTLSRCIVQMYVNMLVFESEVVLRSVILFGESIKLKQLIIVSYIPDFTF